MSAAAILRLAVPAALLALVPLAAAAQTGAPASERGMPEAKPVPAEGKSERALPTQTKDAAPAPAAAERAMPAKEK